MADHRQIKAFAAGMCAAALLLLGVSCAGTPGADPENPVYVRCDPGGRK